MFYSVAVGRTIGIFLSWSECSESVTDYHGAIFRKWTTLSEATEYLNKHGILHEDIEVHAREDILTLHQYCEQNSIPLPFEETYERQTVYNLKWGLTAEITNGGLEIYQKDWNTGEKLDKGLRLKKKQWVSLTAPELTEALKEVQAEVEHIATFKTLGGNIHVSVTSPYKVINIRYWFHDRKTETKKPTKEGITLRESEWQHLLNIAPLINLAWST